MKIDNKQVFNNYKDNIVASIAGLNRLLSQQKCDTAQDVVNIGELDRQFRKLMDDFGIRPHVTILHKEEDPRD